MKVEGRWAFGKGERNLAGYCVNRSLTYYEDQALEIKGPEGRNTSGGSITHAQESDGIS